MASRVIPFNPNNGRQADIEFQLTDELGKEGLNAFYGHVSETYIEKLRWPEAYKVYDEMRRRDPTLRSILNAIKLLARQAEWKAEPASDKPADQEAADFLQTNLEDMSHTVEDLVDDVFTCLPFGWSSVEICYKRRNGPGGEYPSQFTDGRVGWRKMAFRRQSSFARWELDANGGLAGWWQIAAPDYEERFLPIEKLLHFVAERDGNNPEGMSLFESAYEPYHFVTNLQIISGIGWQRAFVGLPVFEFEERPSPNDNARVKSIGQGLTIDEKQFVSLPPKVKFRLESTENSGANALLDTIKMYRILMTQMVLADFLFLGTSDTGSWALGSDKSQLFIMAVNGYLDKVAAVKNRFGVARLFEYNEFPGISALPRITHSEVRKPNLTELGQFIQQIAPYITLGDEDEIWIRQQAGMPEVEEEDTASPADDELDPETGSEDEGGGGEDVEASDPFRTGYP